MAIYTTFGGKPIFKAPDIPIIKVKIPGIDLVPDSVYVPNGGQNSSIERKALFEKLEPWLKFYFVTWQKLNSASEERVSNADLVFILDLCLNLSAYYSDTSSLYHVASKDALFFIETINYIILGSSPNEAQVKAKQSIQKEEFISGEPFTVTLNQMSDETKAKLKEFDNKTSGKNPLPNETPGSGPSDESLPEKSKTSYFWLLAGGLLLLISQRR
jgi:hypothetical protein